MHWWDHQTSQHPRNQEDPEHSANSRWVRGHCTIWQVEQLVFILAMYKTLDQIINPSHVIYHPIRMQSLYGNMVCYKRINKKGIKKVQYKCRHRPHLLQLLANFKGSILRNPKSKSQMTPRILDYRFSILGFGFLKIEPSKSARSWNKQGHSHEPSKSGSFMETKPNKERIIPWKYRPIILHLQQNLLHKKWKYFIRPMSSIFL